MTRKQRTAPLSLRLNNDQRSQLEAKANGRPLGEYIKDVIFEQERSPTRVRGMIIQDRSDFAKALGLLGQSNISKNLEHITIALASGSMPYSGEVLNEMLEASETIRQLRDLFISALGLKIIDANKDARHDP